MGIWRFALCLLAATFASSALALAPLPEPPPPEPAGDARVVSISGEVQARAPQLEIDTSGVRPLGLSQWAEVKPNEVFNRGAQLRTGSGGRIELLLADGGGLTLLATTEVEMISLRDQARKGVTRIRLTQGRIEATATLAAASERAFLIETPAGVHAVEGIMTCVDTSASKPCADLTWR